MSHVTYPDKNIEEKLNYFIDYFDFVNNRIHDLHLFDIETHLSLIEKIIFQVENNTYKGKNKNRVYIYNHLNNNDFQFKLFRNSYPDFLDIEKLFNEKKALKDNKWNEWIFTERIHILHISGLFKKRLEYGYYNFIIKELEGKLACKHKLKTHQEDIHTLTRLLVSEFRFKNIDIRKARKTIESFTKNEIRFTEIISPKKKTKFFITRIYDLKSKELIDLELGDINLVSIKDDRFKKIFNSENSKLFAKEYINDIDSVVAIQRIEYYDSETATNYFINNVAEKIDFLNHTYGYFLSVNPANILTTSDFQTFSFSWKSKFSPQQYINSIEKESIKNYAYNILKKSPSKAKFTFLEFESTFQNAVKFNSITLYWQYLENLFWIEGKDKKEIQDKMSSLLLLNHKEILYNTLYNVLVNELVHNHKGLNHEYVEIYKIIDKKDNSVKNLKPYLSTKFENYIYNQLLKKKTDYKSLRNYYKSIFIEASEIRNSLVHSGKINKKSNIKLEKYLGVLINRVRKLLITEINKSENENYNFNEIIDLLLKESNNKLQPL